jgi:hypothetical protein
MALTDNKEKKYSNEHPKFSEKTQAENVERDVKNMEMAGSTFNMSKYKQYEAAVKRGVNLKKILPPGTSMKEITEFYKIYNKRNK